MIFFQQRYSIAHLQCQLVHSVDQHTFEDNGTAISATACQQENELVVNL